MKAIALVTLAAAVAVACVSPVSAQSAGVTAIVTQMTKDPAKMKAACSKGREGITAYAAESVKTMMRAGASVNPADGQAAGETAAKRCPEFMR